MASLKAIRDALKTTIQNYTEKQIYCYDTVPGVTQLPAVVILPTDKPISADFQESFNRGHDTWYFDLYILTSLASTSYGQEQLDELLTGAGPNSIREAIFNHPDLGLTDGTDAFAYRIKEYGGKFEFARIEHQGAVLQIRVITDGRV
jgi:hypothetical protein